MGKGKKVAIAVVAIFFFIIGVGLVVPTYGIDVEFILECSTWYESYELTSKSEFIVVWGKGATDCYDMLDTWAGKLFLWHNEDLITDKELETAIIYLIQKDIIVFSL